MFLVEFPHPFTTAIPNNCSNHAGIKVGSRETHNLRNADGVRTLANRGCCKAANG